MTTEAERPEQMQRLTGHVTGGIGDFSKLMETIPGLLVAYERKIGMQFFPGTLNVQLDEDWHMPRAALRLEKEEYGGLVSVWLVPCTFLGRPAWILRTEATERGEGHHPKSLVEVACDVRLRDHFQLEDGDEVKITFDDSAEL